MMRVHCTSQKACPETLSGHDVFGMLSCSRPLPSLKFDGILGAGPISRTNEHHPTRRAIHPLWESESNPLL